MADTPITGFTAILGSAVDAAADVLPIVDVSVPGAAGNKKILVAQLFAVPSQTLVTPILGVAAATSINKVAITAPATGSTLTIADGVTLTVSGNATIASTPPTLGANTFTAMQTITQASANAGILASTGYSLTGSNTTAMVDFAGTWNTSGAPTAVKINITNTASDITSKVVDIQVGGVSKFSVTAGGTGVIGPAVVLPAGVLNSPAIALGGNAFGQTGLYQSANGLIYGGSSAAKIGLIDSIGFVAKSDLFIGWGGTTPDTNNPDTYFSRSAAGSIELRTNSNGQRLGVKQLSELLTIAAAATSTTTIQKPANSIVLGVAVRVTVAVTCTSTFDVGDSGSANRFNTAAVSKAVNTTNPGTKAGAYYNATAEGIIITPDTVPTDATGRVRVVIYYIDVTPPTS